jgi:hypothetical protein
MDLWTRWARQPQNLFFRRALFQVHLWVGIAVSLYIGAICLSAACSCIATSSTQVQSAPLFVSPSGPRLSDGEVESAAKRAHPGFEIANAFPGKEPNQAVEIHLENKNRRRQRLFDPYTGADLGNAVPLGFRATSWLLDLHDNLLFGRVGRRANAVGAGLVLVLAVTGAVIWWPGIKSWRRSLWVTFKRRQRFTWRLHSALGFWFFGFVVMWGVSGLYLAYPQPFSDAVERLEEYQSTYRAGERILYWLGYSHFGRFGNRIPGCGPACDKTMKVVWAAFGVMPVAMLVTGVLMWWNRKFSSSSTRQARADLRTSHTPQVARPDRGGACMRRERGQLALERRALARRTLRGFARAHQHFELRGARFARILEQRHYATSSTACTRTLPSASATIRVELRPAAALDLLDGHCRGHRAGAVCADASSSRMSQRSTGSVRRAESRSSRARAGSRPRSYAS